jgi:hypothetical protein
MQFRFCSAVVTRHVTYSPSEGRTLLVGLAGVKRWPTEHRTIQVGAAANT